MRRMIATAAFSAAFLAALPAFAQFGQQASELRGSGWVNSKELSLERLKGKVVALYFYEEG